MTRVLFDTNIVLDVLLQREPWLAPAQALWEANDAGKLTGYICASTLTDIFYIARKLTDANKAREAVQICLERLKFVR